MIATKNPPVRTAGEKQVQQNFCYCTNSQCRAKANQYKLPIRAREKIYRQSLIEILKNLDQWFRGDKFHNHGSHGNDGEQFVDEVESKAAKAMDRAEKLYE